MGRRKQKTVYYLNKALHMNKVRGSSIRQAEHAVENKEDETGCNEWIEATGRTDLKVKSCEDLSKTHRVCSVHFEKHHLLKKKLKKDAVPTLFLNVDQDADESNVVVLTPTVKIEVNDDTSLDVPADEPLVSLAQCRICAKSNTAMVRIFEGDGLRGNLSGLINKYLPITVSKTDRKPLQTCLSCLKYLEQWDKFNETTAKSDALFRNRDLEEKKKLLLSKNFATPVNPLNFGRKCLFLRDLTRAPPKTAFEKQLPSIVCRKCNFEFYGKNLLDLHFCVCKELQCSRCLTAFNSLQDHYLHINSCFKYACRGCGFQLKTLIAHREHEMDCDDFTANEFLHCKRCDTYRTLHLDEYERHVLSCDTVDDIDVFVPVGDRRPGCFACRLCAEMYASESELEKHVRTCSVYVCTCTASFHAMGELVEHSMECEAVIATKTFNSRKFTCTTVVPSPRMVLDISFKNLSNRDVKREIKDEESKRMDSNDFSEPDVMFKDYAKLSSLIDEPAAVATDDDGSVDGDAADLADDLVDDLDPADLSDAPIKSESALEHYERDIEVVFSMLRKESFETYADLKCLICELLCDSKEHLKEHLQLSHQGSKLLATLYYCELCKMNCRTVQAFNKHAYNKHTPRICYYCPERFSTFHKLNVHIKKSHLKDGKFEGCRTCHKMIKKAESKKHREWHYLEESLTCDICSKIVIGTKRFAVHMSEHRCNEPVLCTECGSMVPKYQYRKHLQKHKENRRSISKDTGHSKIDCEKCGRSIMEHKLKLHMKRKHSEDLVTPYNRTPSKPRFEEKCPDCNKIFTQRLLYERHMKGHKYGKHRGGFQCHYCAMGYGSKKNLESHIRAYHQFEEPHCAICNIRFNSIQEKYRHKRTDHAFSKFEYLCCGSFFARLSTFQKHFFEKHVDGKPQLVCRYMQKKDSPYKYQLSYAKNAKDEPMFKVACGHCGKETRTMTTNNIHIRNVHVGVRSYHCSYCQRAFKTQTALTHHEYIHLDLKPYKCKKCNQAFRQPNDMKKHERRHDGDYAHTALPAAKKRKCFDYIDKY